MRAEASRGSWADWCDRWQLRPFAREGSVRADAGPRCGPSEDGRWELRHRVLSRRDRNPGRHQNLKIDSNVHVLQPDGACKHVATDVAIDVATNIATDVATDVAPDRHIVVHAIEAPEQGGAAGRRGRAGGAARVQQLLPRAIWLHRWQHIFFSQRISNGNILVMATY